jgi:hypothetical protein
LCRNLKAKDRAWRLIVFFLATLIFDISMPIFAHDFIIDTGNELLSFALGFRILTAAELTAFI